MAEYSLRQEIKNLEEAKGITILGFESADEVVSRAEIKASIDSLAETDFDEIVKIAAEAEDVSDIFA